MRMNDANGGEGELRGLVSNVTLKCGAVTTAANLFVGDKVPFNLLLGRPWQIENMVSIEEEIDGTYLLFRDAETQQPRYRILVQQRESEDAPATKWLTTMAYPSYLIGTSESPESDFENLFPGPVGDSERISEVHGNDNRELEYLDSRFGQMLSKQGRHLVQTFAQHILSLVLTLIILLALFLSILSINLKRIADRIRERGNNRTSRDLKDGQTSERKIGTHTSHYFETMPDFTIESIADNFREILFTPAEPPIFRRPAQIIPQRSSNAERIVSACTLLGTGRGRIGKEFMPMVISGALHVSQHEDGAPIKRGAPIKGSVISAGLYMENPITGEHSVITGDFSYEFYPDDRLFGREASIIVHRDIAHFYSTHLSTRSKPDVIVPDWDKIDERLGTENPYTQPLVGQLANRVLRTADFQSIKEPEVPRPFAALDSFIFSTNTPITPLDPIDIDSDDEDISSTTDSDDYSMAEDDYDELDEPARIFVNTELLGRYSSDSVHLQYPDSSATATREDSRETEDSVNPYTTTLKPSDLPIANYETINPRVLLNTVAGDFDDSDDGHDIPFDTGACTGRNSLVTHSGAFLDMMREFEEKGNGLNTMDRASYTTYIKEVANRAFLELGIQDPIIRPRTPDLPSDSVIPKSEPIDDSPPTSSSSSSAPTSIGSLPNMNSDIPANAPKPPPSIHAVKALLEVARMIGHNEAAALAQAESCKYSVHSPLHPAHPFNRPILPKLTPAHTTGEECIPDLYPLPTHEFNNYAKELAVNPFSQPPCELKLDVLDYLHRQFSGDALISLATRLRNCIVRIIYEMLEVVRSRAWEHPVGQIKVKNIRFVQGVSRTLSAQLFRVFRN